CQCPTPPPTSTRLPYTTLFRSHSTRSTLSGLRGPHQSEGDRQRPSDAPNTSLDVHRLQSRMSRERDGGRARSGSRGPAKAVSITDRKNTPLNCSHRPKPYAVLS